MDENSIDKFLSMGEAEGFLSLKISMARQPKSRFHVRRRPRRKRPSHYLKWTAFPLLTKTFHCKQKRLGIL